MGTDTILIFYDYILELCSCCRKNRAAVRVCRMGLCDLWMWVLGRQLCRASSNWNYRVAGHLKWMLGTKPESSAKGINECS